MDFATWVMTLALSESLTDWITEMLGLGRKVFIYRMNKNVAG